MNAQTANSSVVMKKVNHFAIKKKNKTLDPVVKSKPIDYFQEIKT